MTDLDHTFHDTKFIEIADSGPRNWLHGTIKGFDGYSFSAMVFENGSQFGIEKGRVSKLQLKQGGNEVAYYDRDWDISPATAEQEEIVKAIVAGFPIIPTDQEAGEAAERFARETGRGWSAAEARGLIGKKATVKNAPGDWRVTKTEICEGDCGEGYFFEWGIQAEIPDIGERFFVKHDQETGEVTFRD